MKNYLKDQEMRTIVRSEKLEWREVTGGVPGMIVIYANDIPKK